MIQPLAQTMKSKLFSIISWIILFCSYLNIHAQNEPKRARDFGCSFGVMQPGKYNAITDVPGVSVGHTTIVENEDVRTGVTAILPHGENVFQSKVPAAIYIGNGFGKLIGISQVEELGNIETPILLTNTLSVPQVSDALADYMLDLEGNEKVRSVNPIVGETNDGYLNNIRKKVIQPSQTREAILTARSGNVAEGNVGAGTGTVCFGYKGGIGTSSRKLPKSLGNYHVGVLAQTNFGGTLIIDGIKVGELLGRYPFKTTIEKGDGSCMIVVATDAPLDTRNLKRLAKRAILGMAKTGGIMSNGSGDYVIAFSSHPDVRVPYHRPNQTMSVPLIHNEHMSPLFMAVIEATEEAIINSLFAAETMRSNGVVVESLPKERIEQLLKNRTQNKRK